MSDKTLADYLHNLRWQAQQLRAIPLERCSRASAEMVGCSDEAIAILDCPPPETHGRRKRLGICRECGEKARAMDLCRKHYLAEWRRRKMGEA